MRSMQSDVQRPLSKCYGAKDVQRDDLMMSSMVSRSAQKWSSFRVEDALFSLADKRKRVKTRFKTT